MGITITKSYSASIGKEVKNLLGASSNVRSSNDYFQLDAEGNLFTTKNFYSTFGVGCYGLGPDGVGTGSGGVNVIDDLLSDSAVFALSARQGKTLKGLVDTHNHNGIYATPAFVNQQISALVGSSYETLNTLSELGTALGNDPNFATSMTTLIGTKEAGLGIPQYDDMILSSKRSGVRSWVNKYALPVATAAILGGIMVGTGLSASAQGLLSHSDFSIETGIGGTLGHIRATERTSWNNHLADTSPHLSTEERTYFNKLKTYLLFAADNSSMHSTIDFYSDLGVGCYGLGSGDPGTGSGANLYNGLDKTVTGFALDAYQGFVLNNLISGKANSSHNHLWAQITDKPTTFTPAAHVHPYLSDSDNRINTWSLAYSHIGTTGAAHGLATAAVNGFMSAAQFSKLLNIADNANNYSHPTGAGSLHIPAGGTVGQILRNTASGTATWQTEYSYSLPLAASGTRGGVQIGYAATGANIPLLLSSEKGYVALTNDAIIAGLTGGTTLQYFRGDKTFQTLDTSVVPELGTHVYFTEARVRASVLTGLTTYNSVISATDSILVAFGRAQGQINARALLAGSIAQPFAALSVNFNGTTIVKTDADYLKAIQSWFEYDSANDSIRAKKNFYSTSGVGCYGLGDGGSGSGGANVLNVLTSADITAALSANMGRVLNETKQPLLNGTGLVRMNGTVVSYDNSSYALSSALSSHASLTTSAHGLGASAFHADSYFALAHTHPYLLDSDNRINTWTAGYTYSTVGHLPLSGGTISGGFGALTIYRNSGAYYSTILFKNTTSTLGYLGFSPDKKPVFVAENQTDIYTLYHAGNANLSTVPWAASTFTEGGTLLSNKYLGISANAVSASVLSYPYLSDENLAIPPELKQFGAYALSATTATGGDGYINTWRWAGAPYITQLYLDVDPTYNMSIRHRDSAGVWNSWKKIWTEANLLNIGTTASSARTALELTGTVGTHNHNGTYALIGGSTSQAFSALNLTLVNGDNLTWGGLYGAGIPTIVGGNSKIHFYPSGSTNGIALTLNANNSATFSSSIAMNGALTGATTGNFSGNVRIDADLGLGVAPLTGGGSAKWLTLNGTTTYSGGSIFSIGGVAKGYAYAETNYVLLQGTAGVGLKILPAGTVALTIEANGIATLSNATQSTAYTNGALVLSGGLGIAKDLYSNGNISTNGYITPASSTGRAAGVYGLYDSNKISHIWGIGTAYKIAADGLSLGNFYGLISKYNTVGGSPHIGASDMMSLVGNGVITMEFGYGTGRLWTSGYIESASYIKGTSVKIGANWEATPNGTGLDLTYNGAIKAKIDSSGNILAMGGIGCYAL